MQTIRFLPDRLNSEPVVFRGFTTPEMGLAALAGLGVGLLLSLPFIPLAGWVIIPTGMLLAPLLVIGFGGRWLSRIKRGKPENYLYRRLDLLLSQFGLGTKGLVQNSRVLALRRLRPVVRRQGAVHE